MVNGGDCVAIFQSVHRVMKAEKILKGKKLNILLIPTPRQLTSDCGLAIRYAEDLRYEIETALAEAKLLPTETWLKRGDTFELVK